MADSILDCYLTEMDDDTANEVLRPYGISRECLLTGQEINIIYAHQKSHSIKRKGENRRAWSKHEFTRFLTKLCSVCVISGLPHSRLEVTGDRIWDECGWYKDGDVSVLGVRVNNAKFAIPAFHSKDHLRAYQIKNNISRDLHPLHVLVLIVRP
ncbi:hypothetical protein BC830DRAFT_1144222 [Chytriomyces sp. MP71]|nr:hypothetical protein BC830DRAFT_1144222 [Chytriomyces sp. MP71]